MYEHANQYAEGADVGAKAGAIECLDKALEHYEQLLGLLKHRVGPVTNQYDTVTSELASPRPEPATQLLGRVERLSDLNGTLERITRDIDL